MNLFKCLDYKSFLRHKIRENKGTYGYKSQLARAARCRNSYFSQVLNADADLSPEHALGLANFWQMGPAEKDYFLNLVHYARAGTPELKKYYESLLKGIAAEYERNLLRSNAKEVPHDWKAEFYSSWHYTAIHDLTTFPGGQTVEAIAARLELPKALVEETLRTLKSMELVEKRESGWEATVPELIVPTDTFYSTLHIDHWTRRAAHDALRRKRPLDSLHKCWVFGISPGDYQKLREMLLEHIQKSQALIPNSERQELACMNLHLFVI